MNMREFTYGVEIETLARTDYVYDTAGRITDIKVMHKNADGNAIGDGWTHTRLGYSHAAILLTSTLEGNTATYTYDTASRLVSTTAPTGDVLSRQYDRNGNISSTTESAVDTATHSTTNYTREYGYDFLDRIVRQSILGNPTPNTTAYAYDSLGRQVRTTDSRGKAITYLYDALGRPVQTTHDSTGVRIVVGRTYDANDRLVSETDPFAFATARQYDSLDRLLQITYPDGTLEQFPRYDALGNVLEHKGAAGLVTHTQFDALGRPTQQTFDHLGGRKNPGTVTFGYDPLGRPVSATNADATVIRRYDTLGNINSESVTASSGAKYTSNFVYDNKGLCTQGSPPSPATPVTYNHDAGGRVTEIKQNGLSLATFDYLGERIIGRHYANNTDSEISYDPTGCRVENISLDNDSKNLLDSREYSWDSVYNLKQYQVTGGSLSGAPIAYTYTGLNRLDPSCLGVTWHLDFAGNRGGTWLRNSRGRPHYEPVFGNTGRPSAQIRSHRRPDRRVAQAMVRV